MSYPTLEKSWLFLVCLPWLGALVAATPVQPKKTEPPSSALRVVTTLGVLGDLTRTVGGEFVEVEVLANASQDPHYVEPTPILMQEARKADVLIESGLQLELWAEKIAAGSGNPKIQRGQPGRVIASTGVATLELPRVLSREWGDVHPYGNPHVWLDPLNTKIMAANIANALVLLDGAHSSQFKDNLAAFEKHIDEALFGAELIEQVGGKKLTRLAKGERLDEYLERKELKSLLGGWLAKAAPLKGRPIVTYHKTFIYFAERFGMTIPIEIEEKPGIPPSARHRERVLKLIGDQGVRTVLQAVYHDRTAGDYLAAKTSCQLVVEPIDVGPVGVATDYFAMIDNLLDKMVSSEKLGS